MEGLEHIRREALGKVQYVIMDNHPRHGLAEEIKQRIQDMER